MTLLITGGTAETRLAAAYKQVGRGSSGVDLVVLEPESGIESAREVKAALSRKPYQSKVISVVIPEAETLTPEAQNALLKTLEEPPGGAQLILLTHQPDLLLPTVRSRCQVVDLGWMPFEVTLGDLKSAWQLWTRGSRNQLFEASGEADPAVWAELFRQILLWQLGGEKLLKKSVSGTRLTEFVSAEKLTEITASLSDAEILSFLRRAGQVGEMIRSNVNHRLALENLFLRLPTPKEQS